MRRLIQKYFRSKINRFDWKNCTFKNQWRNAINFESNRSDKNKFWWWSPKQLKHRWLWRFRNQKIKITCSIFDWPNGQNWTHCKTTIFLSNRDWFILEFHLTKWNSVVCWAAIFHGSEFKKNVEARGDSIYEIRI